MIEQKNLTIIAHLILDTLSDEVAPIDYYKLNNPEIKDLEEVLINWMKSRGIEVGESE